MSEEYTEGVEGSSNGSEDYGYTSNAVQGERTESLDSVDRIFNTEDLLYSIKKTLLGWEWGEDEWKPPKGGLNPVCTTETANKIINSMRAIIHTTGILSNKDDDEINFTMAEICKMVIFNIYDDEMVEEQDVEYIVNLVDHAVSMFMGIIRNGEGAEHARQILSGVYQRLNEMKGQYDPAFRVGTKNRDFVTFWGKR